MQVSQSVSQSVGQSIGWLVSQLVGRQVKSVKTFHKAADRPKNVAKIETSQKTF